MTTPASVDPLLELARGLNGSQALAPPLLPTFLSARELMTEHPKLHPAVIDGLVRRREVANLISASKTYKTYTISALALHVATGRCWLDTFRTERGDVLIIDNELHQPTMAGRLPAIAESYGMMTDEWADHLYVESLRGKWRDLYALDGYFKSIQPGRFNLIILDALYRFWPANTDENDNGKVCQVYNQLDQWAEMLDCAFLVVHHASKGSQADKSVTDVGAGAGAQSRAVDAHVAMRQHQVDGCVVLDARLRSFKPIDPIVLEWQYPRWHLREDLDPTELHRPSKNKRTATPPPPKPPKPEPMTVAQFVTSFVTDQPVEQKALTAQARQAGVSGRQIGELIALAVNDKKIFRWKYERDRNVYFANREQDLVTPAPQS